MKRKILLLLILFATPTMTLSETSCSCFLFGGKDKNEPEIVDISEKKFNDVSGNDITTGELLYKEIRTQVAGWANPKVNSNDILIDNNIIIRIWNSANTLVLDNADIINTGNYKVKITIDDADIYFQGQEQTEYSININNFNIKIVRIYYSLYFIKK